MPAHDLLYATAGATREKMAGMRLQAQEALLQVCRHDSSVLCLPVTVVSCWPDPAGIPATSVMHRGGMQTWQMQCWSPDSWSADMLHLHVT